MSLIAVSTTFSAGGCKEGYDRLGSPPAPDAGIVFIGPPRSDARCTYVMAGAQEAANQLADVDFQTIAPHSASTDDLTQALDDAIKASASVVCAWISDPADTEPLAARARKAGVQFIAITGTPETPDTYGHVYVDYPGGAGELAGRINDIAPDRRSFAVLRPDSTSIADEAILRHFRSADQHIYQSLTERAVKSGASYTAAIQGIIDVFPNVGAIISLDPQGRLAFAARYMPELEQVARDGKRATTFASLGATPRAWPALQSGRVSVLVGPLDPQIGGEAIALAVQAITGVANSATTRVVHCEWIAPDSLQDFSRRYADAAGMRVEDLMATAVGAP